MLVLRRIVPTNGIMRGSFSILKADSPNIEMFYPKQLKAEMGKG